MIRRVFLTCIEDCKGDNFSFTKGNVYNGMIRNMIDKNNWSLQKAYRIKDDFDKRILIFKDDHAEIIEKHFKVEFN